MNREFMMLRRSRAAARVRAPTPRSVEIVLPVEARRKFADLIMLLDTAERRSVAIKNERKKVKLSKIRDACLSRSKGPPIFLLRYLLAEASKVRKATKDESGLFLFLTLLRCYG